MWSLGPNRGVTCVSVTFQRGTFSRLKYQIHMWNDVVEIFMGFFETLVYETCISHINGKISHIKINFTKQNFHFTNGIETFWLDMLFTL